MTQYRHPTKDALFAIHHLSGIDSVLALDAFADFDLDTVDQVVEEAGKFAADVLSPINIPGDQSGCEVVAGGVVAAPGFADAYQQYVDNGWQSIEVSSDYDGMGMPGIVNAAAMEAMQAACMSFSLAPMLTGGAISALQAHGSEAIRNAYIPKMSSGVWTGSMNLTESQAGSDLSVVATKAHPEGDHYRISGSKIFITWGDQEFSENIVHLVLARLPDAPDGVRGLSLFVVPKFLLDENGDVGERNEVSVASIEHKLGIHASPTCVMSFGEDQGAVGDLVGEENNGLACMFTMMNHARISVGVQGVAISERAYQLASSYAKDRKQGRAPGIKGSVTIIHHPDVRRMLLVMKSQVEAMRGLAFYTAGIVDLSHHADDEETRQEAKQRAALLTPVLKAWATETAQEITSLGVQVHGGMGFVEETGAAQHMRDARILTIYEGTTGIQAVDFAGRKVLADEGKAMTDIIGELRSLDEALAADERLVEIRGALSEGAEQLQSATSWLVKHGASDPHAAGSASVSLLMLAGTVLGGWQMARAALQIVDGAASVDADFATAKIATTRFYAQHILPRSRALHAAATAGSDALMSLPEDAF
jgi:alkylation response protein AidB-like acyl-CoA dehydrogenase